MKRFCMSLLLALSAGVAGAQELDIESRYTFEDLDRFWKKVLSQDAASASTSYRTILTAMNSVPEESKNRQETVWETGTGSNLPITYFIEAIPSNAAALLAKREMGLHMYMIRQDKYQPPETKNPIEMIQNQKRLQEEKLSLAVRRKQAGLELFLIKVLRYREAENLEAKCSYLKEAETFYAFAQAQQISVPGRVAELQGLMDLNQTTHHDFEKDLLDQKVCQSKKVTGRSEALAKAETSLNGKIVSSLQREYAQSIDPIATVLKDRFGSVLDLVYTIDPLTGDLLEFETLETNAKANIDLVASDAFGLQPLFPQLDAINFEAIKKSAATTFIPEAIDQVNREKDNLVAATRLFLGKLNSIYETVPLAQKSNFQDCRDLDIGLDNVLPKNVATKDFAGKIYPAFGDTAGLIRKMTSCLTITQDYLKGLQTRDSKTKLVDEFATRLEALSREMLRISN